MKEKLKRSLVLAAAPLVLILMVTTASAPTASAATSVSHATIQAAATPATIRPDSYPSIWSLECNAITWGKIGINPITGQLYQCEYVEGEGYLWLPIYVCPNTPAYATDRPNKTC
jgi:hypothetical protein